MNHPQAFFYAFALTFVVLLRGWERVGRQSAVIRPYSALGTDWSGLNLTDCVNTDVASVLPSSTPIVYPSREMVIAPFNPGGGGGGAIGGAAAVAHRGLTRRNSPRTVSGPQHRQPALLSPPFLATAMSDPTVAAAPSKPRPPVTKTGLAPPLPHHHRDSILAAHSAASAGDLPPPPHLLKNAFTTTHYHVAASPWHALHSAAFRLHNETANIVTGLLPALIGAALLHAVAAAYAVDPTTPHPHLWRIGLFGVGCVVNGLCVGAYHALCSHPPWYHVASALDLLGVALAAVGYWAVRWVPGMGADSPAPTTGSSLDGAGSGSSLTTFAFGSTVLLAMAVAVAVTRLRLRRESPAWLLAINASPYPFLMLDFALARYASRGVVAPHGVPTWWLCPATVLVGLACYILKLPERVLRPGAVDLYGGGHTLWQIGYATCFALYGFDGLACVTWLLPTTAAAAT